MFAGGDLANATALEGRPGVRVPLSAQGVRASRARLGEPQR